MRLPGRLCRAGRLSAISIGFLGQTVLVANPAGLPAETVFGITGPEAAGLSSAVVVAPIEARGAGLREALERIPGIFLQESFGGIEPPRLSVRGSGIQSAPVSRGVGLWLDGFPLNLADGSFNSGLIETAWLSRARLAAGPAAGVPAMGGNLSLWSALLEPEAGGEIRTTYGKDNTGSLAAWHRQPIGAQQVAAGIGVRRTDGWREYSRQRRESGMVSWWAPVGECGRREITGHLLVSRPRIEVPGPLTLNQALENPQSVSAAVRRDRPRRDSEYLRVGSRVLSRSDVGYLAFGVSGANYQDEFRQLLPNGITNTTAREGTLALDGRRDWQDALEQQTEARLSWQSGWRRATRERNQAGNSGPRIGDNRLRPDTVTLAIDHAVQPIEQWRIEAGGSLIHARRDIRERFPVSAGRPSTAMDWQETHIAPRVGAQWSPAENFQVALALSRTYEPPTFDDLIFTTGPMPARQLASRSLDSQRADQVELTLRGHQGGWNWRVAAYEAQWKDEFLRLLDTQGNPRGTVNAQTTRRRGAEVALDRTLWKQGSIALSGWAAAQWSYFRFDDDPSFADNRLAGIPPLVGSLGIEALTETGWFVAPSLRGQTGRFFVDHANTLTAPGFAVWTVDLGRRHPSGWAMHVRVENILDKRYVASPAGVLDQAGPPAATAVFLPGVGRRWELGLDYAW